MVDKKETDSELEELKAKLVLSDEALSKAAKEKEVLTRESRGHQTARNKAEERVRKLTGQRKPPVNPIQPNPLLTPAQQARAKVQGQTIPTEPVATTPDEEFEGLKEQEKTLAIEATLYKQMNEEGLTTKDVDVEALLEVIDSPQDVKGQLETIKLRKQVSNQKTEIERLADQIGTEENDDDDSSPGTIIDSGGINLSSEEAETQLKRVDKQYKIAEELAVKKRGVEAGAAHLAGAHKDPRKVLAVEKTEPDYLPSAE